MIRLFCGYDAREAAGWHVFVHSVLRRASVPVSVHRLDACGVPQGTNAFTLSRFLVPHMLAYRGWAVFADAADMLCLADVAELAEFADADLAVRVVKHAYTTRHPIKYVGTPMEAVNVDYPRKNWASLMVINCEHPWWRAFTPDALRSGVISRIEALQFDGLAREEIGDLPREWNVLVDEGQPAAGAKLLHWTAGIPAFAAYRDAPSAALWHEEFANLVQAQ